VEPTPDAQRLTRLEEALLFAEHRLDQLHHEMLAASARLERVSLRLAAVERAIEHSTPGPGSAGDGSEDRTPAQPD
jgi:hypothetical protein